jgi:hypothetical protein
MPSYYANEAVFDLPERPFLDKTVHALQADLPDGNKLAVFVHRRPIEAGRSLRALVDQHVASNQTRLHAFTVLDEAEAIVGGQVAIVLRTRFRLEGAAFYQREAHVAVEGTALILAVSAPDTERAAGDETFASIVQTLTWRTT